MGADFQIGYEASFQITDLQNHLLYEVVYDSSKDAEEFLVQYSTSVPRYFWLKGLILPLRTTPFKSFLKDLFFPTFFHLAVKTNNWVVRFYLSIFIAPIYAVTLAMRLITAPLRLVYCCIKKEEKHPLVALIEESSRAKDALTEGLVVLHQDIKDVQVVSDPTLEEEGIFTERACKTKRYEQIALKALPREDQKEEVEEKEEIHYLRMGRRNGDKIEFSPWRITQYTQTLPAGLQKYEIN